MKPTKLIAHDKQIAQFLVEENRDKINQISKDCVAPLVAVRQAVRGTCLQIGKTLLKSEPELTNEQFHAITRWICDVYIKQI